MPDVVLIVSGDTLQTAYSNRFLVDTPTPAGGFARTVASPAEYPGKHIGIPVDHIRLGIATLGDQPYILRHRRVGRTGVLAVHHLVEVLGIFDVSLVSMRSHLK
jgi:hypothetical protein